MAAAADLARSILETQPESAPLLALLAAAVDEATDPAWEMTAAAARLATERTPEAPLLAGATLPVDPALADRWLRDLLRLLADTVPDAVSLATAEAVKIDAADLLDATLAGDEARLGDVADRLGLPRDAVATLGEVALMPLLQAVRRRFDPLLPASGERGACPCCGAWATLAERRGLERERHLRCARCGADWTLPAFRCAFCGEAGQGIVGVLAPEGEGEARQVETCEHCHGALKSLATLRAWQSEAVALADLASVDLDLAALDRGYQRPEPEPAPGARVVPLGLA